MRLLRLMMMGFSLAAIAATLLPTASANAEKLRLPNDETRDTIYGTDGSDLLTGGGILGGCFAEQLSEMIIKNSLNVESFDLASPYE